MGTIEQYYRGSVTIVMESLSDPYTFSNIIDVIPQSRNYINATTN